MRKSKDKRKPKKLEDMSENKQNYKLLRNRIKLGRMKEKGMEKRRLKKKAQQEEIRKQKTQVEDTLKKKYREE